MVTEIPKWEANLWSYIGSGNGKACPLKDHCEVKNENRICLDNLKERISRLLVSERFILRDYDFIGCHTCGKMQELVEKLACHYLRKGHVRYPPVPTDLVSLIGSQDDIEIRTVPLRAYHGAIWRVEDSWVIHLNANDSDERKRFALFHEAFHILAHRQSTPVFNKRGGTGGSFNETMADCFASCILMPEAWVRKMWTELKDLDRIAEIFEVPIQVMCIRLKWLDLL
jgi:hypothetical protein